MKKLMATSLKTATLSVAALLAFSEAPALATEGLFPNGSGARHGALAGAGSADGKDASVQTINPASLTYMLSSEEANSLAVSVKLFSPNRQYTISPGGNIAGQTAGTYESDKNAFYIPNMAWAKQTNGGIVDVIGFAVSALGGMNTTYLAGNDPFGLGVDTGINYEALQIQLSLAKKFGALSVGVQPVIVRQTFSAQGLTALGVPQAGTETAWGGGVRVGVHYDGGNYRVAASYTSRMYMDEFQNYASLFGTGVSLDLPQNVQVGVAVDLGQWTVMADYRWINYEGVQAIGGASDLAGFLAGNGVGFGWSDVHVIKIGVEGENVLPNVDLRAGYSYNTQPLNTDGTASFFANILAPATVQHHITAGASLRNICGSGCDFELTGMYVPNSSVDGASNAAVPAAFGGGSGTTSVEMYQYAVTAGIKWGW